MTGYEDLNDLQNKRDVGILFPLSVSAINPVSTLSPSVSVSPADYSPLSSPNYRHIHQSSVNEANNYRPRKLAKGASCITWRLRTAIIDDSGVISS